MIEKITASLENAILSGKYAHVEKLPSLSAMAKQYRVSYGTARQAVALLARKGLVSMEPGRGTFVRSHRLFSFAWVWFGAGESLQANGMTVAALNYTQDYDRLGTHKDVILDMMLLSVKHLPAAKAFADSCRIKGVDGLLVNGHSKEYLPYVEEVARHLPVVSPFGLYESQKISCVHPDVESLVGEVLADWSSAQARRIGFLSSGMNHPNYQYVHRVAGQAALAHGSALAERDTYVGSRHDMENWVAGLLARPDHPRHWITTDQGSAVAVRNAAELLGIDWRSTLKILTFSVLPETLKQSQGHMYVGLHDYARTVETAIGHLKAVRSGQAKPGRQIPIPMTLHRPGR